MRLGEWLEARGRGEPARIVREANVSFSTVRLAVEGKLSRRQVAERISAATGGAVTVAEMRNEAHELPRSA